MAHKNSPTKKTKSKRSSLFSRLIWVIWTVVTGGGVAGWVAPDMPIVGPIVQRLVAGKDAPAKAQRSAEKVWPEKIGQLKDKLTQQQPTQGSDIQPVGNQAATSLTANRKPADTILIASYNIQVFGTSKLSKAWVMEVLARVVRQFDVVAIQEVRSKEDRILPDFVAVINADGSRYDFVIGPRLGRSVSTEQYAFVYDTNRIEVDRSAIGSMADPQDMLHREPFVARFRARVASAGVPFSFWLINIHTDPDEVASEVSALADVFQVMRTARADEDDVILLGDLNASDREFGRLGQVPGITWAVSGTATNTRRNKMYDNLLFDRNATTEYTGRWGVVDLQAMCGLTREQALEVSDHLPVWAEFRGCENSSPNNTAQLPGRFRQ